MNIAAAHYSTILYLPATLPSPLHIGIAAGLRRVAQLQRDPVAVSTAVLARWGHTDEATCERVVIDLLRDRQAADAEQLAVPTELIDAYLGCYLPMLDEPYQPLQPFTPSLLTWSDVGTYALQAAGYRQSAGALTRLQEVGLVTRAQVAVAPAELPVLLDQAERGRLTTLDADGQGVRVGLTAQGRSLYHLSRQQTREAAC